MALKHSGHPAPRRRRCHRRRSGQQDHILRRRCFGIMPLRTEAMVTDTSASVDMLEATPP